MLTDITIGQFFPGTSVLHRMDPRTKLLLLIALMAAIFIFDTPGGYAVLTGLAALLTSGYCHCYDLFLMYLVRFGGIMPASNRSLESNPF